MIKSGRIPGKKMGKKKGKEPTRKVKDQIGQYDVLADSVRKKGTNQKR